MSSYPHRYLSRSTTGTIGEVGLSRRVLLLCHVRAKNAGGGWDLGQNESLGGDDLRFGKDSALSCAVLDISKKEKHTNHDLPVSLTTYSWIVCLPAF
jgi:hypothetical protein